MGQIEANTWTITIPPICSEFVYIGDPEDVLMNVPLMNDDGKISEMKYDIIVHLDCQVFLFTKKPSNDVSLVFEHFV